MIVFSYLILILTCLLSGSFALVFQKNEKIIKAVEVFGGAFLLAVCFLDILPIIYTKISINNSTNLFFFVGMFVLLGFFLQLVLEFLPQSNSKKGNAMMLLLGVSLHAFFEGFALVTSGNINTLLFIGVIIHNIPIAIILINSFIALNISKNKSFLLLLFFSIMGPFGAIINNLIPAFSKYSEFILAFVVGILLHVSVSILFDTKQDKKYNFIRLLVVLISFIIVAIMPK